MASTPKCYFNRELSWLAFNLRVLEEAMDETHPLLERVKFFAIFHTNLDEFFMIRVSALIEQVESGLLEQSPDGLTARGAARSDPRAGYRAQGLRAQGFPGAAPASARPVRHPPLQV